MKKIGLVFIFICIILVLASCDQECKHDNMSENTVEPTCIKNGQITHTCPDCAYTYLSDITEPKGHVFNQNIVIPTCTKDGYTEYFCHCGYSYISDIVSAVGHDYEDTYITAGCTEGGYSTHTCNRCDYSFISNNTDPKGHEFIITSNDPTCEAEGVEIYTCECGYSYTIVVSAPFGHELEMTVTDPTCTDEGYTVYTCHCGFSYTSDLLPPIGHMFERTVNMPTLSDMGCTEFACQNEGCGFEYTGELKFYSDILEDAYADNSEVLAKGIDISHHNYNLYANGYETLNWEAIKAAGIDYVIIRVGDASIGIDPTFEKSYADAKAAGLDVGVYFYTRATSVAEIRREANLVLSALDGKQFEYPIYLDLEDDSLIGIDPAILNEMCVEFFTVLQRSGYYTGLYVNHNWLNTVIDKVTALSRFEIWYARYDPDFTEDDGILWDVEKNGRHLGMWQYSDSGVIDGVDTVFDFNFAYKDYPAIIKENGFNGYESDAKFYDSEKSFVWVIYDGSIKIRSKNDYFVLEEYDADADVIGFAKKCDRFEVIEITDRYVSVKYNEQTAYISANEEYVSFTGIHN